MVANGGKKSNRNRPCDSWSMALDCKYSLIDKKLENSFTFLKLYLLRELWRYHALRGSESQRSAPPPPPWWRIGSLPSVRGSYSPLPPPQVSPTYQNPIIFSAFNVVMSSLPRRIYGNLVLRDLIQILDVADNSGPMTMGARWNNRGRRSVLLW